MGSNPFLMMEEDVQVPDGHNPFLSGDFNFTDVSGDNPFSGSNPFSDFISRNDEVNTNSSSGLDIFGTTPMDTSETHAVASEPFEYNVPQTDFTSEDNNNLFDTSDSVSQSSILYPQVTPTILTFSSNIIKPNDLELSQSEISYISDEEIQTKPSRPPPPPPRPVAPETKDLILSVTGQMDFTSSHLLDRIPPTRSPSPISMRDLHSPSPTPDFPLADFESTDDNKENDSNIFGNEDINEKNLSSETVLFTEDKPLRKNSGNILFETTQNKPDRPAPPVKAVPPARPPSRPLPPVRPVPPIADVITNDTALDINLFEAAAPTAQIKPTNEAILSLYSAPKKQEAEKQIDFLSDDILDSSDTSIGIDKDSSFSPLSSNDTVKEIPMHSTDATFSPSAELPHMENELPSELQIQEEIVQSNLIEETVIKPVVTQSFVDLSNPFSNVESFAPSKSITVSEPLDIFTSTTTNPIVTESVDIFSTSVTQSSDFFSTTISSHQCDVIAQSDSGNVSGEDPFSRTPRDADLFDEFSAKFESTGSKTAGVFDAFGGASDSAWGDKCATFGADQAVGFGTDTAFDAFLTVNEPPPVPTGTPALFGKDDSQESDDEGFNVFIKPKDNGVQRSFFVTDGEAVVPVLAPPPKQVQPIADPEVRFNPFDKSANFAEAIFGAEAQEPQIEAEKHSGSETPPTPLFDDDISQPLEDFPRMNYSGPGWEMQLRQPNKKKITGQRFWKKIFVKLAYQGDNPVVQLYNSISDKEPFQELPLQACYSVSDIAAQQYDQFGKIFTIKLQYVFYKERPGVRPGQVTKAERLTNKISQFAAYAIQGDYQGVKEFGSDLKKLGLPVEHAPQISQLFKIGSQTYEDVKQFSFCIEEALFHINAHRDRALTYKMEEVQITAVDELYVEQDAEGCVLKQIARVRLFFLGFLSGMPDIELGVNDMRRQGKEVVGRHDIIPVVTEEWIRVEDVEFHACVQPEDFHNTKIIKFKPPDACYIELMRFRIRPPKNRELPLQLKAVMCVTGNKVELRADCLVPGFASRKLGQVPCEDVMIRFPIPECWIYLFRVEKHFRYGSVKSAHRRTGKIKGIERFLGAMETLQESLIEVTSGQAKYEHQHRSIVWRIPRLPKEGQGAYTTHNLVCRMALTSYDQIPDQLAEWCYVEFTMPATQVSHMTVRSVSLQNHDSDDPPEKYVRYLARHEYKVGIEHTQGSGPNAYTAATTVSAPRAAPATVPAEPTAAVAVPSSDSDSD